MRLDSSWSQDNLHNNQLSFGASGAIVAHPRGITLTNDLSDTFAIIHAKGAKVRLLMAQTEAKSIVSVMVSYLIFLHTKLIMLASILTIYLAMLNFLLRKKSDPSCQ